MARRLGFFFFFIFIAYVFFPISQTQVDWLSLPVGPWFIDINLTGFSIALLMCARVCLLMVASLWVQRSSQPGEMIQAMVALRVPQFLAVALETTLELLAGENKAQGSGRGQGKGSGKGHRRNSGLIIRFKQMRRGDFSFLFELIEKSLRRAEHHIQTTTGLTPQQGRDVAVIAGISVAIMGLKMFQLMPALPIAPGHKNLLIIPLFLLASSLTHSRFGGLWTGLTVGLVNFMLGFGKFGLLEVFQFMLPGLLADLLLPMLGRGRLLRWLQLLLIGAILGLARFIANFLVIVLAGAPLAVFFIYVPMLFSQVLFGMMSVMVASPLLIWSAKRKQENAAKEDQPVATTTSRGSNE